MHIKSIISLALIASSISLAAQPVITDSDIQRAKKLVSEMTLEEKVNMISGHTDGFHTGAVERLGIPAVRMADGPQGVRNNTNSTYYPCGISIASSFSREAAHGVGQGIGYDAKARGVGFMLCPGVNIYRCAKNGRNFEYYGEDPYLASQIAVQYINGIQESKVTATIKHFAANNSEYDRHWTNSLVDERTLNEIYFPAFRTAIEKAKVGAVMTCYNPVNGIHGAENPFLIKKNLRKWGHKGVVMSDWTSTYTTLGCLISGLDIEMPKAYVLSMDNIKPLLDNGVVSETLIDEKCVHILSTFSAFGFLDEPMKDESIPEDYEVSRNLAYNAAIQGIVMLKNDAILPLTKKIKNIVVCGPNADIVAYGGGSGRMDPFENRNISLFQALQQQGKVKVQISEDEAAISKADAVIVSVGYTYKTESESFDRTYELPEGQNELILKAANLNKNVIVVVNSGGEIDVKPWFDKVGTVLMAWYGGQEGGKAITDIIFGKVSPSGRLPFTFWGSLDANPAYKYYEKKNASIYNYKGTSKSNRDPYPQSTYAEGIFVGYRGVEKFAATPMFPFGYGLTYSNFEYSNLKVVPSDEGYDVSFTITNTGKKAAAEVAQVYVAPENPSIIRPAHELKGFEKVALEKGKSARVTVHLDKDAFSFYDVKSHDWVLDKCSYTIQVGANASDIKLSEKINLK